MVQSISAGAPVKKAQDAAVVKKPTATEATEATAEAPEKAKEAASPETAEAPKTSKAAPAPASEEKKPVSVDNMKANFAPFLDTLQDPQKSEEKAKANSEKVTVFLIDDFLPETDQKDENGNAFNHGETMAKIIEAGGTTTFDSNSPVTEAEQNPTAEEPQTPAVEADTATADAVASDTGGKKEITTESVNNVAVSSNEQTTTVNINGETVTDNANKVTVSNEQTTVVNVDGEAVTVETTDQQDPQATLAEAPPVEVVRYNVDDPNSEKSRVQMIADGLTEAYRRYEAGEDIDAVNLSQAAKFADMETMDVQAKIKKLTDAGIPVVIAGGNMGVEVPNTMATPDSIIVMNSEIGSEVKSDASGPGNVLSEGKFTSHATANVTPLAAKLKNEGKSLEEIKAAVQQEAIAEGGSLDTQPGIMDPVFTTPGFSTFVNNSAPAANPPATWQEQLTLLQDFFKKLFPAA